MVGACQDFLEAEPRHALAFMQDKLAGLRLRQLDGEESLARRAILEP